MFRDYEPYVSAAERKRRARQAIARFEKQDPACAPVIVAGNAIATTFWGRSWCSNMERYSDFYNRLARGRSYVRSGSVIDLRIAPGAVTAQVMGTRLYTVEVSIAALPKARWEAVCRRCAGAIDSLVELLQGRFSKGVMEHICAKETGLFPSPQEIAFKCSCPDWASMCKHVAAVLYGIGARLDESPQLLFALRKVDEQALIATAGSGVGLAESDTRAGRRLAGADLSALFEIEIAAAPAPVRRAAAKKKTPVKAVAKRTLTKARMRRKKTAG